MRVKTRGAPRVETDKTTPYKNQNSNSLAKPTPTPRVEPATRPMSTTPKKRPMPLIVTPNPTYT